MRPFASHATLSALLIAPLAGCVPPPERPPAVPVPALPTPCRAGAAHADSRVLRVDPAHSQIRIAVYRAGRLAHLGHNHVVATRAVEGYIEWAEPLQRSRLALCLPLAAFSVDEPVLRAAAGAGFERQPTPADIAATHRNMLSATQLDAERHPYLIVTGAVRGERPGELDLTLRIAVRDHLHAAPVTVRLERRISGLIARGKLTLKLSDLGIEPFTALFGALRVRDLMELQFELAAVAVDR